MTLARLIASGLGSGLAPKAPGTAGSLAALGLGAPLLWASHGALAAGVLAACLAGWWAIPRATAEDDPPWVVIDEFAGMWLAMLALPGLSWTGLAAAFLLFRLFDIAKPGPIDMAQRLPGATGIMLDDLLAGAAAAACLWAIGLRIAL